MAEGTKLNGVYKCALCGNVVEVLHSGAGALVCCGEEMGYLEEKSQDEGLEKHVPVFEKTENRYLVKVGSVEHPMEDAHYIEWIEVTGKNGNVVKRYFNPGDSPVAEFCFEVVSVRAYCNLHGLWSS